MSAGSIVLVFPLFALIYLFDRIAARMERAYLYYAINKPGDPSGVDEHLNVLVTGATGVGKSYLASALGQAACRKRFRVMYRRVPRLFDEIALARADGTYAKLLARFAKADLLVLDDLGLGTPTDMQRHDLLEVMEDRYGRVSTVVTSQLPVIKWHEWIGDPTVADAVLDRLVHNAYKLDLRGSSKRKEKPNPNNEKQ